MVPTISGTLRVGAQLTARTTGWLPADATFTYKWFPEQEQWLITSHHSSAMPEPQKTHE